MDAGDLEAAVPANFNLITYEAEQLGRQSFYGQGAGRFPTAENVVQDCLTVLSGKRGFYTDRAVTMFLTSWRGAPLLRPHQRTGCVPAGPHRGDVGQRRGHHRRGGRVRNAGLGQGSA